MFTNILIGVDGRSGGQDAIALAQALAAPHASFTLAHAYGLMLSKGAAEALPVERAESMELLARERDRAGISAALVVHARWPAGRMLHRVAEEDGTDLIVVGSTRHALLGRVLLGDDTAAAVDGAPCAIAIAPRGFAASPHGLSRIGIGYDGSPESECALAAARQLATGTGAAVTAFSVVSLPAVEDQAPVPADWPREIDALVARRTEELAALPGVDTVVSYGGPREELSVAARECDLLIVGSRGYGPLRRLVHGSVSRYLMRHVGCPLLILPRGAPSAPVPEHALDARPTVPVGA